MSNLSPVWMIFFQFENWKHGLSPVIPYLIYYLAYNAEKLSISYADETETPQKLIIRFVDQEVDIIKLVFTTCTLNRSGPSIFFSFDWTFDLDSYYLNAIKFIVLTIRDSIFKSLVLIFARHMSLYIHNKQSNGLTWTFECRNTTWNAVSTKMAFSVIYLLWKFTKMHLLDLIVPKSLFLCSSAEKSL